MTATATAQVPATESAIELVLLAKADPALLFRDPTNGGVGFDEFFSYIVGEAKEAGTSVETSKERDAIKSMAFKVKQTRTGIEKAAKDIQTELKARASQIKARTETMAGELNDLHDKVRGPLTKFEIEDKERKEKDRIRLKDHQDRIEYIRTLTDDRIWHGKEWVQVRLAELEALQGRDFEEFQASANQALESSIAALSAGLDAIEKRAAEQHELEELRRYRAEMEAQRTASAPMPTDEPSAEATPDLENEVFEPQDVVPELDEVEAPDIKPEQPAPQYQQYKPATSSRAPSTGSGISETSRNQMTSAKTALMENAVLSEETARAVVLAVRRNQIPNMQWIGD